MMSTFINLPSIINYFYLHSFYNDLELSIKSSASVNVASTSLYIATSIIYSRTLNATKSGLTADEADSLYNSMRLNIERARQLNNPKLSREIGDYTLCNIGLITLLKSYKTNEDVQGMCFFSISSDQDVSWTKPLNELVIDYQKMDYDLKQPEASDILVGYFASDRFAKHDSLTFYETVAMRSVSLRYMDYILNLIDEAGMTSSILTWTYCGCVIIFVVIYVKWWIKQQMSLWNSTKRIFLVLNDETLNNMYIKSFFGYDLDG